MAQSPLLSERRGSTLLLTLDRPGVRNALGPELVEALTAAVRGAAADPSVRAIVLTGAGEAFCAGADLSVLRGLRDAGPAENAADLRRLKELYLSLLGSPLPVLAAVNGPALAGGCGLATACDLVFAAPSATFGYPEVRVGFVAAMVSVLLVRQVGERAARTLLLTGKACGAEEALALGLVTRVAPAADLLEETLCEAGRLAGGAPGALALTKELLLKAAGMPLAEALDLAASANLLARRGEEVREGIDAFLEKRRPSWSPR